MSSMRGGCLLIRRTSHTPLRNPCQRRVFFSRLAPTKSTNTTEPVCALMKDAATEAIQDAPTNIVRHGAGDGVVTLNVGGTEFITLRSTIQINPVLRRHVWNAESNKEFTKGAVFIDRDPAQFGLILQHLRNRADMIQSATQKKIWTKNDVLIQVPKDPRKMRDLYVEAKYFQIDELVKLLCKYDLFTRFSNWVGGGSNNPFHTASQVLQTTRRALLATGGVGVMAGTMNEKLMKDMKEVMADIRAIFNGESHTENADAKAAEPA